MNNITIITVICLLAAALAVPTAAWARHLGTVGRTYPIAEPDALEEIRAAAAKVDWKKAIAPQKRLEQVKRYRPADLHPLPAATQDRVFRVDMTYTLDMDVPDGRGGILYPRGYTFNPLDYISLTSVIVVLDGSDQRQVDWFRASELSASIRTRLLLSAGDYYDLSTALRRPVYYLTSDIAGRLNLSAVPAVIRQRGRDLEVREVFVPHQKKEENR